MSLSQYEQLWHLNRVTVLFSTCASNFGLKLSIALCALHVLSCVLVKILHHTTAVHVPCATIESPVPKLHFHTFPKHVLIDLVSANVQFIVLAELIT